MLILSWWFLCKGAVAERSYPMSEVRGGGREELPHVRGQGQQPRVPGCDSAGAAERSYPTTKVRGRSQEDPMPKETKRMVERDKG